MNRGTFFMPSDYIINIDIPEKSALYKELNDFSSAIGRDKFYIFCRIKRKFPILRDCEIAALLGVSKTQISNYLQRAGYGLGSPLYVGHPPM
jgi:hypothetical protein